MTLLDAPEDMEWLDDVHYKGAKEYACAILVGNEDCPDMVVLYAENHYQSKKLVLKMNKDLVLEETKDADHY